MNTISPQFFTKAMARIPLRPHFSLNATAQRGSEDARRNMMIEQQERPRAVFSTEDFALMKQAVAHYLKEVQDKPESSKYSALYHRLGRLA